jgi:hypothetical protein
LCPSHCVNEVFCKSKQEAVSSSVVRTCFFFEVLFSVSLAIESITSLIINHDISPPPQRRLSRAFFFQYLSQSITSFKPRLSVRLLRGASAARVASAFFFLSCVLRLIFLINDDDQARSKLLVSRLTYQITEKKFRGAFSVCRISDLASAERRAPSSAPTGLHFANTSADITWSRVDAALARLLTSTILRIKNRPGRKAVSAADCQVRTMPRTW